MAIASTSAENSFMELEINGSVESLGHLLEEQNKIFHGQIEQLQRLVVNQCKLTGVNPLSQEMAAAALSIKIGKKPRDLLNPKAVKYMQSIFAIKDTIGKKETREISALCGVTVSQVREFFSGQRSKVRKLISLVREKAVKSDASDAANEGCSANHEATCSFGSDTPSSTVDVNRVGDSAEVPVSNGNLHAIQSSGSVPESSVVARPFQMMAPTSQEGSITGIDEDDKKFLENILNLMRKDGTFSGQVKLLEWILQIHNPALLVWFLTKSSIEILATWLSQAATEEQTTVLDVILKVLCHLPLHKALPAQMSTILQTVNKLRFYRTPDISNRARVLLSRWSKMLVRNQLVKYPSILNSSNGVQKDIIRKQRINEILSDEFWKSKIGFTGDILALSEISGNDSTSDPKQALKLLTASCDHSSRKQSQNALSIKAKERRKVRLVEQLDQKPAQAGKTQPSNHGRPISADDIQKAKMRAMFMQHKYGKADASSSENMKIEDSKELPTPQSNRILPSTKIMQLAQVNRDEEKLTEVLPVCSKTQMETSSSDALYEELLKRLKRSQLQWQTPPEMKIDSSLRVCAAESSKELNVQTQRIRREKETFYSSKLDIPPNPKEPWDVELDFDDSLTPEIPIEQSPDVDVDAVEEPIDHPVDQSIDETAPAAVPALPMASSSMATEPDLELLAVLLKNPELVFALTSGQGKNLTSDERVALLDMIKRSSIALNDTVSGMSTSTPQEKLEPVPISLPSPTPPSDVERMAGWRSAFPTVAKAPSQQSQLSGAALHSISNIALTPTATFPTAVLPLQAELQSTIVPMCQSIMSANNAPQPVAVSSLTSQRPRPALRQSIASSGSAGPQRLNAESSLLSKSYIVGNTSIAAPTPTSAAIRQETFSHSLPSFSSLPSLPPPQRRRQLEMISDTSLRAISPNPNPATMSRRDVTELPEWGDTVSEWPSAMPESSAWRPTADNFSVQQNSRFGSTIIYKDVYETHRGRSSGREDIDRFRHSDTWSPESSPVRPSEFRRGLGQSHVESRRSQGLTQRQEWSSQRSSGHRDEYRSSGGRWRDRDQGRRR